MLSKYASEIIKILVHQDDKFITNAQIAKMLNVSERSVSSYMNEVAQYCEERNYINDRLYAESFIQDKTNLNKYGSNKIRYDLISKGVSKDIIDEALDLNPDEEYERAFELAHKRIKSYKNDDKKAIYRKLGGYLQRRGYTYDIVSKVLRQILEELE